MAHFDILEGESALPALLERIKRDEGLPGSDMFLQSTIRIGDR